MDSLLQAVGVAVGSKILKHKCRMSCAGLRLEDRHLPTFCLPVYGGIRLPKLPVSTSTSTSTSISSFKEPLLDNHNPAQSTQLTSGPASALAIGRRL